MDATPAAAKYDIPKTAANFAPLTPLSYLARTEAVYPDHVSVIDGARRFTWRETAARCRRFASRLAQAGIGRGDTVAIMAPNIAATLEAHFAVPMAGAVLNALNVRLDAATIAFILEHGEARVLLTDREFSATIAAALAMLPEAARPFVVDIDDGAASEGERIGAVEYEAWLADGDAEYAPAMPHDEWDAIALNYTSGTTGNPKGVVYHHRGAHLNAMGNVIAWAMTPHPVYLWTLPMF
ncbi:MAG: AMP-binding protein, partial [Acidisphaera sp.]|nr:AMP-binding protein [Acidisphaera sp.]